MKTYVVTIHLDLLNATVPMMGHKICFYGEIWLIIPKLSLLPLLIWSIGHVVVVVALLFYVHGQHLWSCWDGQLT